MYTGVSVQLQQISVQSNFKQKVRLEDFDGMNIESSKTYAGPLASEEAEKEILQLFSSIFSTVVSCTLSES